MSTPITYGACASVLVPVNDVRPVSEYDVPCGADAHLMPALPVKPVSHSTRLSASELHVRADAVDLEELADDGKFAVRRLRASYGDADVRRPATEAGPEAAGA